MTGISQIILLGTVSDIEQSTTSTGKLWLKVVLEIKRFRFTKDENGQDEITFVPINCFSKIAETFHS
jgi:hypothetical protein